jgi:hypothetical protein
MQVMSRPEPGEHIASGPATSVSASSTRRTQGTIEP